MKEWLTPRQKILRTLFDYDETTGVLTHKTGICKGRTVGCINKAGYLVTTLKNRKQYRVHRLIWVWMTGEWPTYSIDHIDGIKTNNAWDNLRDVDSNIQQLNREQRGTRKTLYGWEASIQVDGVRHYLGTFPSETKSETCV